MKFFENPFRFNYYPNYSAMSQIRTGHDGCDAKCAKLWHPANLGALFQSCENYFSSDFDSNGHIGSQFCTCYDNWTVAICPKRWCEHYFLRQNNTYLLQHLNYELTTFVTLVPEIPCGNKLQHTHL